MNPGRNGSLVTRSISPTNATMRSSSPNGVNRISIGVSFTDGSIIRVLVSSFKLWIVTVASLGSSSRSFEISKSISRS